MSTVALGFIPEPLTVPIANVLPSRRLPAGAVASRKFKQIKSSIEEVGMIEPLSVMSADPTSGHHVLLDGHLRLAALQDLRIDTASCLVATDDESYTFNNRVNRLATIQEHHMIRRAVERGVSPERLAKALAVDVTLILKKMALLDGLCAEAVEILKDRQFSPELVRALRKMKPTRQVECVELMTAANNLSVAYPDCRDSTLKALQVAIALGMDRPLVIETPLMWIDKSDTWRLAQQLGGQALVDLIRTDTHTCYVGDHATLHDWGFGCGHCPACELRRNGYDSFRQLAA